MEIFTLLDELEEYLEGGKAVPFTTKCIVDKEEILDIIKEIEIINLKTYGRVKLIFLKIKERG